MKHFSYQLDIKAQFVEEIQRELGHVPSLRQWLRVVGLSVDAIEVMFEKYLKYTRISVILCFLEKMLG